MTRLIGSLESSGNKISKFYVFLLKSNSFITMSIDIRSSDWSETLHNTQRLCQGELHILCTTYCTGSTDYLGQGFSVPSNICCAQITKVLKIIYT
jgi:hypothetical protein